VWFTVGPLLLLLSLKASSVFVLPLIGLLIGVGLFVLVQRCPRCKKSVLSNPVTLFGTKVWMFTPWCGHSCSKCGHPLD
jgi:hypothetical protein